MSNLVKIGPNFPNDKLLVFKMTMKGLYFFSTCTKIGERKYSLDRDNIEFSIPDAFKQFDNCHYFVTYDKEILDYWVKIFGYDKYNENYDYYDSYSDDDEEYYATPVENIPQRFTPFIDFNKMPIVTNENGLSSHNRNTWCWIYEAGGGEGDFLDQIKISKINLEKSKLICINALLTKKFKKIVIKCDNCSFLSKKKEKKIRLKITEENEEKYVEEEFEQPKTGRIKINTLNLLHDVVKPDIKVHELLISNGIGYDYKHYECDRNWLISKHKKCIKDCEHFSDLGCTKIFMSYLFIGTNGNKVDKICLYGSCISSFKKIVDTKYYMLRRMLLTLTLGSSSIFYQGANMNIMQNIASYITDLYFLDNRLQDDKKEESHRWGHV